MEPVPVFAYVLKHLGENYIHLLTVVLLVRWLLQTRNTELSQSCCSLNTS